MAAECTCPRPSSPKRDRDRRATSTGGNCLVNVHAKSCLTPAPLRLLGRVVGADAGLLLGQQGTVPLGEAIVELITAVGDRGGEVDAVGQLEGEDRRGVVGSQALQLWHGTTLSR
jgi:hypothetical protein